MSADFIAAMRQRCAELRAQGPGTVIVAPTNDIDFVQTLRSAFETVGDNEQVVVAKALDEAQQLLAGIEGEESTLDTDRRFGWWTQLTRSFFTMASKEEIARGQHNLMVRSSGVAAKAKPAPPPLMKAVEAWLVARAAGPAISSKMAADLTFPWETSRVE